MNTVTYDLRNNKVSSDLYYKCINEFATSTLEYIEKEASVIIDSYSKFLKDMDTEQIRSRGEYAVEILTLGLCWNRYMAAAQSSSNQIIKVLTHLNIYRKKYSKLKKLIDSIKAFFIGQFLIKKIELKVVDKSLSMENFGKLIKWLNASGEFKDEVKRFNNWNQFLKTDGIKYSEKIISKAIEIYFWFEKEATVKLHNFDGNLDLFLQKEKVKFSYREDALFRRKSKSEYYLNMIGAELMNRGFSKNFKKTKKKILLVPGCMRISEKNCKANINGLDITCNNCSKNCEVAKLSHLGEIEKFKVYIVPHSSNFTKWLERWNSDSETGIIAVACLLNLVPGGYEMRELNLNAQCVLLDFCGCKKHWHPEGIPTKLNTAKILEFLC